MSDAKLKFSPCIRAACEGAQDEMGVCHTCGEGSKLNPVPDLAAGKLFDEWFFSIPRAEMEKMATHETVQQEFGKLRDTCSEALRKAMQKGAQDNG